MDWDNWENSREVRIEGHFSGSSCNDKINIRMLSQHGHAKFGFSIFGKSSFGIGKHENALEVSGDHTDTARKGPPGGSVSG